MADPAYPDVPQVPGVPPVLRDPTAPATVTGTAMTSDGPGVAAASRTMWGIYGQDGKIALAVDSIVSVEPSREFRTSDYPTEEGSFQSFNKVATPREGRVTVAKGGSDADRSAFLTTLDTLIESLDVYNLVMPDHTLKNHSLNRYTYMRTAEKGVTLLLVTIEIEEIRQSATSAFTDTKQPAGTDAVSGGPVQAQTPPVTALPAPTPIAQIPDTVTGSIPPITPDMTAAQRASTTTEYVQNGATIGDLAGLGVTFAQVPVQAVAAQTLTVQLSGQSVGLELNQTANGLFANVSVNDALVIGGVLVQNDNPIVRSSYLGFGGDLFFHDTQGGLSDIAFADLASRVALLYAGA